MCVDVSHIVSGRCNTLSSSLSLLMIGSSVKAGNPFVSHVVLGNIHHPVFFVGL
jgi:hypothetical protein